MASDPIRGRAAAIRLLLLDVDGVLTDGQLITAADGSESKAFHTRDGLGIRLAQEAGVGVGVVSGRASGAVEYRAEELDLDPILLGIADKAAAVEATLNERDLGWDELAFVGDDLVDLPVLLRAGLAVCVADAAREVRERCHHVTVCRGGHGAVRETIELILAAQGRWDEVVARFTRSDSAVSP